MLDKKGREKKGLKDTQKYLTISIFASPPFFPFSLSSESSSSPDLSSVAFFQNSFFWNILFIYLF